MLHLSSLWGDGRVFIRWFNPWFSDASCWSCVFFPLQDVVVASGFTVGKSPTHHKDKLHRCNLQLSGEHAWLFVRHNTHNTDTQYK